MVSLSIFLLMNIWVVCSFFATMRKTVMNIYYTSLYVDIHFNLPISEISGQENKDIVQLYKKMPKKSPRAITPFL